MCVNLKSLKKLKYQRMESINDLILKINKNSLLDWHIKCKNSESDYNAGFKIDDYRKHIEI